MIGDGGQGPRAPEHPWRESFGYAWQGVAHVWRTQRNIRFEAFAAGMALLLAVLLDAPLTPILLVSVLVLTLEVLNTAIEALVDLVTPTFHPLAKIAKDAAAGAVLVGAIGSLVIGFVTLALPLWRWLQRLGGL